MKHHGVKLTLEDGDSIEGFVGLVSRDEELFALCRQSAGDAVVFRLRRVAELHVHLLGDGEEGKLGPHGHPEGRDP